VPHLRSEVGSDPLALLRILAPDVVFRQSQWDHDIDPRLSTANLAFTRLCLVPYEMLNIITNVSRPGTKDTAVDMALHHEAWLVFGTAATVAAAQEKGRRQGSQVPRGGPPQGRGAPRRRARVAAAGPPSSRLLVHAPQPRERLDGVRPVRRDAGGLSRVGEERYGRDGVATAPRLPLARRDRSRPLLRGARRVAVEVGFVLPDEPQGTLKYEQGKKAQVVGEPHKHFG